jgi:hypothetical protein
MKLLLNSNNEAGIAVFRDFIGLPPIVLLEMVEQNASKSNAANAMPRRSCLTRVRPLTPAGTR